MDEFNTDRRASLGCGTLILIALIVIIFSKGGIGEVEEGLRKSTTKLENLEKAISDQSAQLESIRSIVEQQTREIAALKEALQN